MVPKDEYPGWTETYNRRNMRKIELDELRAIQLKMLDSIHQFCVDNSLRYSLSGGSLLGAIRHKGYIPWDDDVDIMLPRPDYEILLNEFENSSERYKIQSYRNDVSFWRPFSKIYDSKTIVYEPNIITGVFIDVFPIEGLPDKDGFERYYKDFCKYRLRMGRSTHFSISTGRLDKLKTIIKRLMYPHREKYIKELDDFYNSFPFGSTPYAGALSGSYGKKEHLPVEVFTDYIDLQFEDRVYKGIAKYDQYLSSLYGDYMQLPSEDKRIRHPFEAYWK